MAKNISDVNIKTKSILFGIITFALILFVLSMVYSFLLLKDNTDHSEIKNNTIFIVGISSFIAGLVSGKINRLKGIQCGFLCGAGSFAVLIFMSLLFRYNTPILTAINIIKFGVILLSSTVGGIIGVNIKKRY